MLGTYSLTDNPPCTAELDAKGLGKSHSLGDIGFISNFHLCKSNSAHVLSYVLPATTATLKWLVQCQLTAWTGDSYRRLPNMGNLMFSHVRSHFPTSQL